MQLGAEICPLCTSTSKAFFTDKKQREYRHCNLCDGVFLLSKFHLNNTDEHERYNTHNNIVTDIRYQGFVKDITQLIRTNEVKNSLGLDFGCGPGPVIQHLLIKEGFHILTYDPYYQPDKNVLDKTYDYVLSCEVVEHFNQPYKAFTALRKLLKPTSSLYIKTDILQEISPDKFEQWGYRHDPTHVFFYTPKTFEFIRQTFRFTSLYLDGRTVVLKT